jgi:F420-non-reducing hydrogenase iron-sulfur subunit
MCSGRVDPTMMMEAFVSGSDGVFVGACKKGECHYTSGNLHAERKVDLTRRIMAIAGLDPGRLVMRLMSSAEGNKFAEYATEFQQVIGGLGPLGKSEGIGPDDLKIRLQACLKALAGRKLRWVMGKIVEFIEEGNLYGERFTEHEIGRLFDEIAMDEYCLREVLERLDGGPRSVRDLAAVMGVPSRILVRRMADLRKMGLADIAAIEGDTPLWAVASDGVTYE